MSRPILIPLWALALMFAVLAIHRGASHLVHDELAAQSRATLDLYVANLRGRLDKFRAQPTLVAEHPVTRALFETPEPDPAAIAAANRLYVRTARVIGASDVYVMDASGTTIAASNWDDRPTFVGQNFAYRPYFIEAMQGRLGRFFALGTTSNRRGYYFAFPVRRAGEVVGALAVKVDVEEMERVWHRRDDHVLVLDDTRMVFMSDRQDWLYRPLGALSDGERARLSETRRYDRVDRPPLPVQEAAVAAAAPVVTLGREAADRFMRLEADMPDAGWTVVMLASTAAADTRIVAFTLIAGVALLALSGAWWASVQRRRTMREKLELEERSRVALERAAADLERRVEERTADLATARDELVQAEKMAALGQMLTGLGHELNQPITAIRSYADNTLKLLAAGRMQAVQDNLRTIADVTERANRLIRHLKSFARKGRLTLGTTPLVGVVQSALQLVAHQARDSGVAIRVGSGISGTAVNADPVRLEQVFVNLLTNALDAVAGGRERWIVIDAVASGDVVEITVADSGPGIPAERRDRVFEPMYTTKEPGAGLGLGLTISYSIMQDMGGTLAVIEPQGRAGAVFRLTLRACPAEVAA
ncbi:MAG: ATP-binding protein [Thalassobaculum sp.]|uniref:sensor histidine kinase n=1 Tax=Thalassobaculum sp. TaxID=2022740 RepID=UPI0032EBADC2